MKSQNIKTTRNSTESGLFYRVTITKPDKTTIATTRRKKLKMLSFIKANFSENDKIELVVNYKPGFSNEGTYHSWKDFYQAWSMFTEEELIKDAIKNY